MIASVTIDENGAITATVESDEPSDDDAQRLAGLQLDDMLRRVSEAALDAWQQLHGHAAE